MVIKYFQKYRIAIHADYYTKEDEYGITNYITIECFEKGLPSPIAELRFYDNIDLRKNIYLADLQRIILNFHINRFNDVYHLIRHESPVFVSIDLRTLDGNVASQHEPVGKEDIEKN